MAAFHGKSGTVTFTGLTLEVTSFTVTATADTAEVTDMGDTWKTYVVGFKDWTATVECNLPAGGIGLLALGTSATLTLDTTTGLAFSGTAICTEINPSVESSDAARCSISFQGSGTLSEA